MGSRPRLSAGAASRLYSHPRAGARRLFSPDSFRPPRTVASGRFHRLTPLARCWRRLRGSTLTPSFPWAYAHGYVLSPPSRLNTNVQLSMGSRPRLSAAAASRLYSIPRDGARGLFSPDSFRPRRTVASGRFHRLTPSATCCRCLRGSTLTPSFPWAHAHGYVLAPLRGSTRTPGMAPGVCSLQIRFAHDAP